jgi:pseudouridine-5'-phosphate glycosidase
MWIAHRHQVAVFATGGIGGVHRGAAEGAGSFDVSADIEALATLPLTVVCAGPKSILDLEATREILETRGVTLIGYRTDEMPAFYSRQSGLPVDQRCDTIEAIADIVRARDLLQRPSAILVMAPLPENQEIPAAEIAPLIEAACEEARARGLRAAQLTPYLLGRIRALTGGRALEANLSLLKQNARLAAEIARSLGV